MAERKIPDWTKFTEADSFLHSYIRDLERRVDDLVEERRTGYTFIHHPEGIPAFCASPVHVWIGDAERCTCGLCLR